MTVERLVELVVRSLTAENELADVHRGHTVHSDRVGVVVVAVDGSRWRLWVGKEPWAAPA